MELDKRFMVLPFCCFGTDKRVVTNHIGEKGYFANDISFFRNINLCTYGTLEKIFCDRANSFQIKENKTEYFFFIPESLVKPKEKRYRPYTLMEFSDKFTVGQPIKFRRKGKVGYERYLILNGYEHEQHEGQTVTYIYIGSQGYTLDSLYIDYEWQEHYTEDFEPFGVEVEE